MKPSQRKPMIATALVTLLLLSASLAFVHWHASAQSAVQKAEKAAEEAQKAADKAKEDADKTQKEANKAGKSDADKTAEEADKKAEKDKQDARDKQDTADASQAAKDRGEPNSAKKAADDQDAADKARDKAQKSENDAGKADKKADKGENDDDPQKANRDKQREKRKKAQEAWEKKRALKELKRQLGLALAPAPNASSQVTATAQIVGLVYDKESRPGEQVTMSLTTNPKKYQNTPGLGVIEMQAPLRQDATGQATLEGTVVDLGDGRQQPANAPLTIQIASNTTSIPVKLSSSGNPNPLAQSNLPISTSRSGIAITNTGKSSDFTIPPVVLNTTVIHGPLSGDGNATRITIDNQPAKIVAESARNVYFDLPPNTPVGSHTAVVQDGGRSAQFPIVNMALVMQAGQTQLQREQSTNYSATVRVGPLPNELWQHGGLPSGQPGAINLRIENASRDVVSIIPSQNEVVTRTLHQQDFQNGQFTLTGRIQSKQSGGFVLNGLAEASFAPIHGQEIRTSTSFDRASVVSVLTSANCVVSNINALKKWLNVPPPGPSTKYIGQYHNWTPDVANDFEVEISHGGEDVEPEDGDTFGKGAKQQVTRYEFKGKDIPHCSYVTVHIPEIPTFARVSWTKNGDVLGGTASIPSQTVFQPPSGTEAFKPPEGANDFHIESKDEIAGFWAKDGVKISLSDNPKDDYRYKVDVSGIDSSNFSQYWIHFVKGTLQDRYKWWWTKDKKQIGKAGEG